MTTAVQALPAFPPAPGTTRVQVPRSTRPAASRPTTGRRPASARVRRRRAEGGLAVAVLLGGAAGPGSLGGVPLPPSGPAPADPVAGALPVAEVSYVVQPGDTLWHIARQLQPVGDIRPLVQQLDADRGGAPLRAGEQLVLPPRPALLGR